jgi:hypothetical protein
LLPYNDCPISAIRNSSFRLFVEQILRSRLN